jgi:nicotinamidase-related amidase
MVTFSIHAQKTALLVIDMVNVFLAPGAPLEIPRGRDLIPRLNRLISACRDKGILIVFPIHAFRANGFDLGLYPEFIPQLETRSLLVEGTWDVEIFDQIDRQKSDVTVTKRTFSAFVGTDLDFLLRTRGIDTVIISGVATHSCCEATARDARHRNYKVLFLSDGTATYDHPDMGWGAIAADDLQRFVLTTMAHRNGEVLSVEQALKRILDA